MIYDNSRIYSVLLFYKARKETIMNIKNNKARIITAVLLLFPLLLSLTACKAKQQEFASCAWGIGMEEAKLSLPEDWEEQVLSAAENEAFIHSVGYVDDRAFSELDSSLRGNYTTVRLSFSHPEKITIDVCEVELARLQAFSKKEIGNKSAVWVNGRSYTAKELADAGFLVYETEEYYLFDLLLVLNGGDAAQYYESIAKEQELPENFAADFAAYRSKLSECFAQIS